MTTTGPPRQTRSSRTAVATARDLLTPDPHVRRLLLGFSLSAVGSGLTMPFLFVYLAQVRDLPTLQVGLLFAWMGLVGLVVSPLGGSLVDRLGPRQVILGALVTEAVGVASLGLVGSLPAAIAVLALVSAGTAVLWPATTSLLTTMVPTAARERVYGLQFMLLNAGLGVGGLTSALLVDVEDATSFTSLYVLDALTYVGYFAVVMTLPRSVGGPVRRAIRLSPAGGPGWRLVLQDRTLLKVCGVALLVLTFGYAQLEAGFAAYAVQVADLPPQVLGIAFAANTATVVAGQLFVLRRVHGHRRTQLLALCAGIWAAAWVLVGLSAATSLWLAALLVVVGLAVFGVGETLWAPVAPALVNALADDATRGRYNAALGLSWTLAMIIGPGVAGLLLGTGLEAGWLLATVGGTALAARLFLRLGPGLTPEQDGVPTPTGTASAVED